LKKQKFPFVPLALAEVLLFAIISITVHSTDTHFKTTPQEIYGRLQELYSSLYYIEGESLSKKQFPVASARWSHFELDPDTFCAEGKNGVWYARGTYEMSQYSPTTGNSTWEILFLPEADKPLYIRVGNNQAGNLQAACLEAGLTAPSTGTR
jgi:surface polysaccharide O-acyltransferase-like enzyme